MMGGDMSLPFYWTMLLLLLVAISITVA
jgi:hypothetical protein